MSSGEVCQLETLMRIARIPSAVVVPEKKAVPSAGVTCPYLPDAVGSALVQATAPSRRKEVAVAIRTRSV
jgi:hypothetical protein